LHRNLLRAGRAVPASVTGLIGARHRNDATVGLVSVADPSLHWLGCAVIRRAHLIYIRRWHISEALHRAIGGTSDHRRKCVLHRDLLSTGRVVAASVSRLIGAR